MSAESKVLGSTCSPLFKLHRDVDRPIGLLFIFDWDRTSNYVDYHSNTRGFFRNSAEVLS